MHSWAQMAIAFDIGFVEVAAPDYVWELRFHVCLERDNLLSEIGNELFQNNIKKLDSQILSHLANCPLLLDWVWGLRK